MNQRMCKKKNIMHCFSEKEETYHHHWMCAYLYVGGTGGEDGSGWVPSLTGRLQLHDPHKLSTINNSMWISISYPKLNHHSSIPD